MQNSILRESSLFQPTLGATAKMGKVVAASPAFVSPVMKSGFQADLGAMLRKVPEGLSGPSNILKKFV